MCWLDENAILKFHPTKTSTKKIIEDKIKKTDLWNSKVLNTVPFIWEYNNIEVSSKFPFQNIIW